MDAVTCLMVLRRRGLNLIQSESSVSDSERIGVSEISTLNRIDQGSPVWFTGNFLSRWFVLSFRNVKMVCIFSNKTAHNREYR